MNLDNTKSPCGSFYWEHSKRGRGCFKEGQLLLPGGWILPPQGVQGLHSPSRDVAIVPAINFSAEDVALSGNVTKLSSEVGRVALKKMQVSFPLLCLFFSGKTAQQLWLNMHAVGWQVMACGRGCVMNPQTRCLRKDVFISQCCWRLCWWVERNKNKLVWLQRQENVNRIIESEETSRVI